MEHRHLWVGGSKMSATSVGVKPGPQPSSAAPQNLTLQTGLSASSFKKGQDSEFASQEASQLSGVAPGLAQDQRRSPLMPSQLHFFSPSVPTHFHW